jgi:hypothetical protein
MDSPIREAGWKLHRSGYKARKLNRNLYTYGHFQSSLKMTSPSRKMLLPALENDGSRRWTTAILKKQALSISSHEALKAIWIKGLILMAPLGPVVLIWPYSKGRNNTGSRGFAHFQIAGALTPAIDRTFYIKEHLYGSPPRQVDIVRRGLTAAAAANARCRPSRSLKG